MFLVRPVLALALVSAVATADEGMWPYNRFPAAKVKERYGFEPTTAWLDHLRLASVRIANGCSAAVVSADGLVMTNHHCARACLEAVSGLSKKDLNRAGFLAQTLADEPRCPGYELNQLVGITDVTQRVTEAMTGVSDEQYNEVQQRAVEQLERACATSAELRCEVVSLYRGGRFDLYTYRRFSDIRLVMAPEGSVAFFGGDPDNFTFPRYDFDVSFLRLYGADGQPAKLEHFLTWSTEPVKEGDLTFVSGSPGGTSRSLTVAQLADTRDGRLPLALMRLAELRGLITEYQNRGAEQKRHSNDLLLELENGFKANLGRHQTLADAAFFAQLVKTEADVRAKVKARPELEREYGQVWDAIAGIVKKAQQYRKAYNFLERNQLSRLFQYARTLVRYADEMSKPNGERLREFADARLPELKHELLANSPVFDELEIATLTFTLAKLRETLGPDHPAVKKALGAKTPAEVASRLVKTTRLKELTVDRQGNAIGGLRQQLFAGGKAAIDASKDPMLEFARLLDPDARAIRAKYETEVDGPMKKQQALLARARFAVDGDTAAPDATFTLRLSYGVVKGYDENGHHVSPMTTIAGAFERHTGADPYALPKRWLDAKRALTLDTPFNFVTTNDIIGGSSGSPMVNQKGELVGLVFDTNLQGLGGEYGFDEAVNRTVAVHSAALLEALGTVYGAKRLVDELTRARR